MTITREELIAKTDNEGNWGGASFGHPTSDTMTIKLHTPDGPVDLEWSHWSGGSIYLQVVDDAE